MGVWSVVWTVSIHFFTGVVWFSAENSGITLGFKPGWWGNLSKRRGGFLPSVPKMLGSFKVRGQWDRLLDAQLPREGFCRETQGDETMWDWDEAWGHSVVSGTTGVNCRASCPGYSVPSGIWIMFEFNIFPPPCFSETVENKCSGIWAAVNGNKCMVYIFSKFLETVLPHGWI